jgi:hypothetical protein
MGYPNNMYIPVNASISMIFEIIKMRHPIKKFFATFLGTMIEKLSSKNLKSQDKNGITNRAVASGAKEIKIKNPENEFSSAKISAKICATNATTYNRENLELIKFLIYSLGSSISLALDFPIRSIAEPVSSMGSVFPIPPCTLFMPLTYSQDGTRNATLQCAQTTTLS